ncbi:hypothetical protein ABIB26_004068 [Arthrobacter sp. UYEF20]
MARISVDRAIYDRRSPTRPDQTAPPLAERFNRTLQEGWAYRQPFTSNQARTDALQPWLDFYNNHRPTAASEANHPSARATNLLTEYN